MTKPLRIALVVPHIFMHQDLLPHVIFSPGQLAISLAKGLSDMGCEVTLYTPGPVTVQAHNVTADLSLFEQELATRGDTYLDLLKKHPFTFVTLARQVQSEIIARAYADANAGLHDIVHIYTNEEDTALPFAQFCIVPVVFTHHDPYNFMVKYKSVMPKYPHLNWVSFSHAQRAGMPADTHWVANIPHGLTLPDTPPPPPPPPPPPKEPYFAYLGRIIEAKGVHLAIAAVRGYNKTAPKALKLKIAGKHYAGSEKKSYWETKIQPELDDTIEYVGFLGEEQAKQTFLGGAAALIVSSIFEEPFGMVVIEAMACGTPVIALDSGALPELIIDGQNGFVASKVYDGEVLNEVKTVENLQRALAKWPEINRTTCQSICKKNYTTQHMCKEYLALYTELVHSGTAK